MVRPEKMNEGSAQSQPGCDDSSLRSDASAGAEPSAAGDLTAKYVPVAIHFPEADTLEFVERDVPTVSRPVYAGADLLLDLDTREPIGWRIYGWSRIAPRDDWRPIDTAPMDGTLILCSDGATVGTARYRPSGRGWTWDDSNRFGARMKFWLPLPSPPLAAQGTTDRPTEPRETQ